jgi:dihydrofolate reductase
MQVLPRPFCSVFMAISDALVMGRRTFDTVRGRGCWPYGDKPVVVLSRSKTGLPPGTPGSVQRAGGPAAVLLQALAAQGLLRLYIDGGTTVRSFLEAGLIDELILTQVPSRLGEGVRLFDSQTLQSGMQLHAVRTYPFGFVQSHYLFQPVQAP